MAAPSTAQAPSSPTESAEPDALVALSVAQAVPIPADMVVTESLPTATGQLRVDFPLDDDMDTEGEPERGPATAWMKENQLMLTYFVAGMFRRPPGFFFLLLRDTDTSAFPF